MSLDYSIDASHVMKSNFSLLRPFDLVDSRKIRIGRPFDGGYVMVDDFDEIDAAYSFGINDDVSWDIEIANMDINVFQYDHTIDQLPENHPRFFWKKCGISPHTSDGMMNIEDILRDTGNMKSESLILKCDIECAEWETLKKTPRNVLSKFKQIVLELHDIGRLGDPNNVSARQAILNLTKSHNVVHVHANNYGGMNVVGGISIPNVVELTLLRKDLGNFIASQQTFPTLMDMPCDRNRADIFIGNFVFG